MAETSLSINFVPIEFPDTEDDGDKDQTGADVYVQAELDTEKNKGLTQFFPEMNAYYRVITNGNNIVCTPTSGNIYPNGSGLVEKSERITFASSTVGDDGKGNSQTTQFPVSSDLKITKISGTDLGAITLDENSKLTALNPGVGIYDITYKTSYYSYYLSNVEIPEGWFESGEDNFPVVILIQSTYMEE